MNRRAPTFRRMSCWIAAAAIAAVAHLARAEDDVDHLFGAGSLDSILFFSDRGKVYQEKAYEIPDSGRVAKGYPLRFFWEDGPRGPDIYYFWSVMHPGTKPDDFPQRVLDERWPEIRKMLRLVVRSVDYTYEVGTGI